MLLVRFKHQCAICECLVRHKATDAHRPNDASQPAPPAGVEAGRLGIGLKAEFGMMGVTRMAANFEVAAGTTPRRATFQTCGQRPQKCR
jgi:hypothetical protein